MGLGDVNWIRIAVAIGDDPDVHRLAEALGCRVAESVGLVVSTLARFPEHAPDGNLAQIPASLVERWAGWEGERGEFDRHLRAIFLNPEGVWVSWEKHNGAAMRDAEAARLRAAEYRRRKANELLESPNGTGNGTANGSPLRTDGRTNITTRGRKRPGTANVDNYAPGHVNLPEPPACLQGCHLETPEGQRRPVRVHTPECPNG